MINKNIKTICLLVTCLGLLSACSSKGAGGNESEFGDGNIPVAGAGGALSDIRFDYDSASIGGDSQAELDKNAEWLKDNDDTKIVIEGHCDERGTVEYNLALGERRAQAVAEYLESVGVDSSRFSTVSYGEEIPLDPASTEEAWSKNRRAHFAVE